MKSGSFGHFFIPHSSFLLLTFLDGGHATVVFGSDPEFGAIGSPIHRRKTQAVEEGFLVGGPVFVAHVAPNAMVVAVQGLQDVILAEGCDGGRGGDGLAQAAPGSWGKRLVCRHWVRRRARDCTHPWLMT